MGNTRDPSALSLEEHNFAEVGTFQPSLGRPCRLRVLLLVRRILLSM
jgi:hypothetical protein